MDSKLELSLDKLPVKRLDAIEEHGAEHFPPDVDYDEKRLSLIRRIDFAWAVQKEDEKKQKKNSKESSTPWPWQNMVENLQLAHQELSVIIDLINTVESNDAVTVAGMTRPKQFPNEVLSDLAVSTATKLQCFRHLGKYFKKSAKSLEQQVSREARFYGALIRLQQNWKVKRLRMGGSAPGKDFTVDLFDNSFSDPAVISRPSLSTVRVDHDSAGMLAINLPPNSCQSLRFGFLRTDSDNHSSEPSKTETEHFSREKTIHSPSDDDSVKETHSVLREVHRTIFDEQVFDLVNHEAFNPSLGVNMTGIRENYLQLNLGQRTLVFISLGSSNQSGKQNDSLSIQSLEGSAIPMDSFDGVEVTEDKQDALTKMCKFPSRVTCEIYLRQIFHEYMFVRAKDRPASTGTRVSAPARDGSGRLGHFCLSLAHRMFSNKVLVELEKVVHRVPYLHLISQPTWHSRLSSWTLFMMVPESVRNASSQTRISDIYHMKTIKSQFRTKVVVNDDCITVEGEGAPNAVSLLKGSCEDICPMNRYDSDLASLPTIILQQVASQVIRWLHEEAVMVGIKANRDFLCLTLELEQGESLSLVAHVDPEDPRGCISWWLVMEDGFSEERKLSMDISDAAASEYRKFLGYLSLDILYSTLMDLVSLCSGGGGSMGNKSKSN